MKKRLNIGIESAETPIAWSHDGEALLYVKRLTGPAACTVATECPSKTVDEPGG